MSGAFFEFTLFNDPRFSWLATEVAGIPAASLAQNREMISKMVAFDSRQFTAQFLSAGLAPGVVSFLTWWTVAIEGVVAAAFLFPRLAAKGWVRDAALVVFLFSTYAFATVRTFGWLLAIMGMTQVDGEGRGYRWRRSSYLAAFFGIVLYQAPWRSM